MPPLDQPPRIPRPPAKPRPVAKRRLVAKPVVDDVFELIDSEEQLEPVRPRTLDPFADDDDDEPEEESKGFWAEVWGSLSPLGKVKTAIGLGIMALAVFVFLPLMLLAELAR